MKIKFAVLESIGNIDRIENVKKLKKEIPDLEVVPADRDSAFEKHISLFNLPEEFGGIVILEDDVQLCKNFLDRLGKVIKGREHEVVSMFESACSKKPLKSEYRAGARFQWCQCNYYPKKIADLLCLPENVEEFKKWYAGQPWNYPIDTYIAYVLKKYKIKYWMEVPFLVQHLDFKSNFPSRPSNRQSRYFIDDMEEQKMKWDYGDFFKKYKMNSGEIKIGTGIVKVNDIFEKTPEFMLEADIVFCDPPYNQSALSSFYTKANLQATKEFSDFENRLIEVIKEIKPKFTFIESGVKQTLDWSSRLQEIHSHVIVKEAYYYHSKKNLCNILCAYDDDLPECIQNLPFADEEKIIELICRDVDFDCIADPCMGMGLVGFYANRYGKKFAGTELNPKRLAVCVERVLTNQRGKIN